MKEAKITKQEHEVKMAESEKKKSELAEKLDKLKQENAKLQEEKAQTEANMKNFEAMGQSLGSAGKQQFEALVSTLQAAKVEADGKLMQLTKDLEAASAEMKLAEEEHAKLEAEGLNVEQESPAEAQTATEKPTEEPLNPEQSYKQEKQEALGDALGEIDKIESLSPEIKQKIADDAQKKDYLDVGSDMSDKFVSDSSLTMSERIPDLMRMQDPEIAKLSDQIAKAEEGLSQLQDGISEDGGVNVRNMPANLKSQLAAEVAAIYSKFGQGEEANKEVQALRKGKYLDQMNDLIQKQRNLRSGLINDTKDKMKKLSRDPKFAEAADEMTKIQQKYRKNYSKATEKYQASKEKS